KIVDERLGAALPRLATLIGRKTANVGFDRIERGDADKGLRGGDRRRRLHLDLVELPAHVAPTESERDVTLVRAVAPTPLASDLEDAAESCEMLGRRRMLAVGPIDVGNAWRSVAGVARIGPELPFLDAPAPWIERRRRRLVGEQLGRLLQLFQQPCIHRPQL